MIDAQWGMTKHLKSLVVVITGSSDLRMVIDIRYNKIGNTNLLRMKKLEFRQTNNLLRLWSQQIDETHFRQITEIAISAIDETEFREIAIWRNMRQSQAISHAT